MVQERFEEKWNNTVVPKLAEDEAACRGDEANLRRRIAEVGCDLGHRQQRHWRALLCPAWQLATSVCAVVSRQHSPCNTALQEDRTPAHSVIAREHHARGAGSPLLAVLGQRM